MTHKKDYFKNFVRNKITKSIYSEEFNAICYFLKENLNNIKNIKSLKQIMFQLNQYEGDKNVDDDNAIIDSKNQFTFLPFNTVFKICEKRDIYCEIKEVNENGENNENEKKKENNISYVKTDVKIYHIHLFKQTSYLKSIDSKNTSLKEINDFIDECLIIYKKKRIMENNEKLMYTYESSYEEEESNKMTLVFKEHKNENQDIQLEEVISEHTEVLLERLEPFIYDPLKTDIEKDGLRSKYKLFLKNFKMTIMIHGDPGTGKTHMIKAICQYLNRTIVIINMSKIKTNQELKQLIYTNVLNKKKYKTDEIIFIIEECDAESNQILTKRDNHLLDLKQSFKKNEESDNNILKDIIFSSMDKKCSDDSLDLKTILDIFDGIRELNGSVIIFTTNHIENLDPAFTREGRMDMILEFKKCTTQQIKQLLIRNFDLHVEDKEYELLEKLDPYPDYLLSVSCIQNISFQYSKNKFNVCMDSILNKINIEEYIISIKKYIIHKLTNIDFSMLSVLDNIKRKSHFKITDIKSVESYIDKCCHENKEITHSEIVQKVIYMILS